MAFEIGLEHGEYKESERSEILIRWFFVQRSPCPWTPRMV